MIDLNIVVSLIAIAACVVLVTIFITNYFRKIPLEERLYLQRLGERLWTKEFLLVVFMLGVLTALVMVVLWTPFSIPQEDNSITYSDLLEYRKDILSVIITAFGAWVGAGAAYFFGHESLRVAIAGREPSREKVLIREISPSSLDWVVNKNDQIEKVRDKLKAEPNRWFIPIVNDDGILDTVINKEALWRFIDKESEDKITHDDILKKKMSEVVEYAKTAPELKMLVDIYLAATMDMSISDVYESMQNKGLKLAVITDEGKPTNFITSDDLRTILSRIR